MTQGWTNAPLIEFAELVSTGPFGSMLHKSDYVSDGVPLINPTNIVDGLILPDIDKSVGPEALARLSNYVLKEGDIVVGRRGEIGRCAVVEAEQAGWVCGTGCFFIRPCATTDAHFLAHLLRSPEYKTQLEQASTGSTMKNMSNTTLAQLQVALPLLHEQRRIVTLLDEAFEGIATAKAHAEQNLQQASDLFDIALNNLAQAGGPDSTELALSDVCEIRSMLVDPRASPYLDMLHVGAGNIISRTGELIDVLTARQEQLISGKFEFDESMVLYSKIRPYLMKVVRPDFSGLCSADIYPLAPRPEAITRDFLYYILLSGAFTAYAVQGSARAGMPKVNREHLFAYRLRLPPVHAQEKLTEQLDALADNVKNLQAIYQRKLTALTELQQSLLHQAFTGQL